MRFKAVPEPPDDLDALATVRDALPPVPRPEADCCTRVVDRVEWVADRETAREWLGLLCALGLARRTGSGGYVRGARINDSAVGSEGAPWTPEPRGGDESRDVEPDVAQPDRGRAGANAVEPGGAPSERRSVDASGERATGPGTDSVDSGQLGERFRARVLGAAEAIDALGEEPRTPDAVFDAVREVVPEWERRRTDAWTGIWRERTARVLGWAVLLGLAGRREEGFVRIPRREDG